MTFGSSCVPYRFDNPSITPLLLIADRVWAEDQLFGTGSGNTAPQSAWAVLGPQASKDNAGFDFIDIDREPPEGDFEPGVMCQSYNEGLQARATFPTIHIRGWKSFDITTS